MGWCAELQLKFEQDGEITRLRRKGAKGPLYVQKPFYPEGGVCHTYLLHPPGGVAGGDSLTFGADISSCAQALFTTPAATKFMRSNGALAEQTQSFAVADGGSIEWLPQETIVFNQANARNTTHARLASDAVFIACDVVSLGRPANVEPFTAGSYTGALTLERFCLREQRYKTIFLDRQHYDGGGAELVQGWGLANNQVTGMLVATPADADNVNRVRQLPECRSGELQVTLLDTVLVVRTLGNSTARAHSRLRKVWQTLRPMLLQREASLPAIWRT